MGDLREVQDPELVAAVLAHGDERAFRTLHRRHTPRLYQFVLRILGGRREEAEDVVQEAWIRAMEGLAGFRWESRFPTWLIGIGLNLARRRLRQAAERDLEPFVNIETLAPLDPTDGAGRLDLERAIEELPDGARAVFVLHDVEGWTHVEIGRSLGIHEGTSKSQLARARSLIRRRLGIMKGEPR